MTPDQYTNQEQQLEVSNGHTLYTQDWGTASAAPAIIFLHGGPGSGTQDKHRTMFNPQTQRVIFFDQRGSGKSAPYGSRNDNTTADLVADIEAIAQHYKLDTFILCGGSWGACLALCYGIAHPERVSAMVLSGIFTGAEREINWLAKGQYRLFFPDVWDRYLAATPEDERADPSTYHFQRALSKDKKAAKESAYAYDNVEAAIIKLDDRFTPEPFESYDPTPIQIELHYMQHNCFIPNRHILDNSAKLTMPIWLVQGRYDVVCPPMTAYQLNELLPKGTLIWTQSGHKSERESWNVTRQVLAGLTKLHI